MSIPLVNNKIIRFELQAGLVCGLDRTQVKLFAICLARMGGCQLPELFDHPSV